MKLGSLLGCLHKMRIRSSSAPVTLPKRQSLSLSLTIFSKQGVPFIVSLAFWPHSPASTVNVIDQCRAWKLKKCYLTKQKRALKGTSKTVELQIKIIQNVPLTRRRYIACSKRNFDTYDWIRRVVNIKVS